MTNAELIKALRHCANDLPCETESYRCKYAEIWECNVQLRVDAADALETAEKRIAELERQHGEQLTRNVMLTAKIPKEGEWQWDEAKCMYRCSVCKSPKAREDMDRKIVKEQPFCYNCGAKMKGEQE